MSCARRLSTAASMTRHAPRTLVLNADYTPVAITSAIRSLALCSNNRAMAVEMSDYYLKSELLKMQCPSVIVLLSYVKMKKKIFVPNGQTRASREMIKRRDNNTCQYCGAPGNSIDHVIPQSKGGMSTWENLVCACESCNFRKADKLLSQTKMKLRRQPRPPTSTLIMSDRSFRGMGQQWQNYLQRTE